MNKLTSPVIAMRRLQLDERLRPFRSPELPTPPPGGWLRAIRIALGMSTSALARRVGIAHTNIAKAERAEVKGTVTLNTLHKIADAMDCDLVYAIVPRQTLQVTLSKRANDKATAELSRVTHTMALEKQTPTSEAQRGILEARIQELLAGSPRRLWDDD